MDAKRDFVRRCVRLDWTPRSARIWREDPADRLRLAALLERDAPDGIVCASDRTAAVLMHALRALGRRVPDEIRLVGIDDVDYAELLPVPLTTLRQPCHEIGVSAMRAMVDRVGNRTCRRARSCCTARWSSASRADGRSQRHRDTEDAQSLL